MKQQQLLLLIGICLSAGLLNSCGPKHLSDVDNAKTYPIAYNDKECYQIVHDTVADVFGVADLEGRLVVPVEYVDIRPLLHPADRRHDLFIVRDKGMKAGVVGYGGKKVIKPKFEDVVFHEFASKTDSIEGFIVSRSKDRNYTYDVSIENGESRRFVDDSKDFARGYYSVEGKELVPCEFSNLSYAGKGYFCVTTVPDRQLRSYKGVYKDGDDVIPCEYYSMQISGNANGVVGRTYGEKEKDGKYFLFDLADGASKTRFYGTNASVTDNYVTSVNRGDRGRKTGVYDFKGNTVIPADKWDKVFETDGFFRCSEYSNRGCYVLINPDMKEVFYEKNARLEPLKGTNLYSVYVDIKDGLYFDKYGVIDTTGRWVVPCRYESVKVVDGRIRAYTSRDQYDDYPVK